MTNKIDLLSVSLIFTLLSGCTKNTIPDVTVTQATTLQPSTTSTSTPIPPTSTPWLTATFPIPEATQIAIVEKEITPANWDIFDSYNTDATIGIISDIAFGTDESVWFSASPGGLIKYKNGEWKNFDPGIEYQIIDIKISNSNIVYVKANFQGHNIYVGRFDGHNWTWWKDMPLAKFSYLFITPDNQILWITSRNEVYQLNGDSWVLTNIEHVFTKRSPDGRKWSQGKWYLENGEWKKAPYTTDSFLPGITPYNNSGKLAFIGFCSDNSKWYMSTDFGFVHVYENGDFDFYWSFDYADPFYFVDGFVSNDDLLWISDNNDILVFDGENWNRIKLDIRVIYAMRESPQGDIWLGGFGEIYYFRPENMQTTMAE